MPNNNAAAATVPNATCTGTRSFFHVTRLSSSACSMDNTSGPPAPLFARLHVSHTHFTIALLPAT
eukprot:4562922-Prorocentrum_lima.AAC.1